VVRPQGKLDLTEALSALAGLRSRAPLPDQPELLEKAIRDLIDRLVSRRPQ
jgi:hypothetical protein